MVITLIGYRGCGKSSVAPLLAAAMGWSWIDSDQVIEQQAGQTIRQIFEEEGESGFRQREVQVMQELLSRPELVLAAGGGAILSPVTCERMRAAGPVVWLQAAPATLAGRLRDDSTTVERRPSLTGRSVVDEIADVLERRQPLYAAAATVTADADGQTPEKIAEAILRDPALRSIRETR